MAVAKVTVLSFLKHERVAIFSFVGDTSTAFYSLLRKISTFHPAKKRKENMKKNNLNLSRYNFFIQPILPI